MTRLARSWNVPINEEKVPSRSEDMIDYPVQPRDHFLFISSRNKFFFYCTFINVAALFGPRAVCILGLSCRSSLKVGNANVPSYRLEMAYLKERCAAYKYYYYRARGNEQSRRK